MKIKASHPLQWIADRLEEHPTFVQKKMFGCEALCLRQKQMLVLAAKEEPWNGLMICTSKEHHDAFEKEFPTLKPHPILGKWLYISQKDPDFESIAEKMVDFILKNDPRIGVIGTPKSKKTKKKSK